MEGRNQIYRKKFEVSSKDEKLTRDEHQRKAQPGYADARPFFVECVYRGAPVKDQLEKLSQGCDVLIATPGRLLHTMRQSTRVFGNQQFLSLDNRRFLILNEADALLGTDTWVDGLREYFVQFATT